MKIAILILFVCTLGFTQNKFEGEWERTDSIESIKIYKEGDYFYAVKIPNEEAIFILNQMVQKDEFSLYGGTYYDVKKDIEVEAKVKLIDNNQLEIKLFKKGQLFHDKLIFKRKINSPETITYKKLKE